jgi:chromosome segregation protein
VQADLRDARLRLLADDLLQLRAALDAEVRDEALVRDRRALVERELAAAQAREAELTDAASAQASVLARAQETWYRLAALEERLRGTASLAAERHRHLTSALPEQARSARDPEDLDREAAAVRAQEAQLGSQLADDRRRLEDAVTRRTDAESAHTVEERALVAAVRAVADRREGLARLTGQVGRAALAGAGRRGRAGPARAALDEAHARVERAQADLEALQAEAGGLDEGEVDLDERHESAAPRWRGAGAADALQAAEREAERERSTWAARRDALSLSLARKDGSGALLAAELPGVLGHRAALVHVQAGSSRPWPPPSAPWPTPSRCPRPATRRRPARSQGRRRRSGGPAGRRRARPVRGRGLPAAAGRRALGLELVRRPAPAAGRGAGAGPGRGGGRPGRRRRARGAVPGPARR